MNAFRKYDVNFPLISLHIPKCAGTGLLQAFFTLPKDRYQIFVYYPDIDMFLPECWNSPRTIVHGHFQRFLGHSVEVICPSADQFITVLRDPFDVIVSSYYYGLREKHSWATSMTIENYIDWWLNQEEGPLESGLPERLPDEKPDEYVSRFVCIGLLDQLPDFYRSLENILNLRLPSPSVINETFYKFHNQHFKAKVENKFPWDYSLLDFIRNILR